jgi:hypothetical protein
MNVLLGSICRAGLNRARIQDALDQVHAYDGVTGHMAFDPLNKNVSPMYLGTVHDGKITYRLAPMAMPAQKSAAASPEPGHGNVSRVDGVAQPYARVGEDGVDYAGPHQADLPGRATIVLFGPHADIAAASADVRTALGVTSWGMIAVNSEQNWGVASTQLVHALEDEHALAVIALDRDSAHLAEQLSLKTFVPVLALANDRALTSTNIPWIFRLPAETTAAEAVRLLAAAAQTSGNNPEKLRDVLASGTMLAGVRFLSTGEPASWIAQRAPGDSTKPADHGVVKIVPQQP